MQQPGKHCSLLGSCSSTVTGIPMRCRDKENETEGTPGDVEDEVDEVCIDFDPYTFIKNLPPLKQVVPRWRRSLLPRQTRQCKRKTLVQPPPCPRHSIWPAMAVLQSLPVPVPDQAHIAVTFCHQMLGRPI
jgi:hypothetical protein